MVVPQIQISESMPECWTLMLTVMVMVMSMVMVMVRVRDWTSGQDQG